jgi:O-antigen/teichoic acid export membrane protein
MKQNGESWAYLETSLEKSLLWSLATTVLPVTSAFITSWIIARFAGAEAVGTVSWVMAFATVCLIPGKFGIGIAASRIASEYGVSSPGMLRRLLAAGVQLRSAFTLPIAVASFFLARRIAEAIGDGGLAGPVRVGALVITCASAYEFCEHFLVGLNRIATVTRIRAAYHVMRVLATAFVVALGFGASAILGGYCFSWLVVIAVYAFLFLKFLPPTQGGAGEDIRRRLMRLGVPLAISGASVALYSQMDKLMLGYFGDMADVGQYTVARNITEVSLFPVYALIMALRPALASRFAAGKLQECSEMIQKTAFMAVLSGVFFTTLFLIFGKELVVLVFSDAFSRAGALMLLFTWVIAMRSLGAVILPSLVAAERTRAYAGLTLASAGLNFLLNIILIPPYGVRGAVTATLASYGFLLLLGLYIVLKTFSIKLNKGKLFLAARASAAGALAGFILHVAASDSHPQASVLLWVTGLILLYGILLWAFRVVRSGDVRRVKSALTIDD